MEKPVSKQAGFVEEGVCIMSLLTEAMEPVVMLDKVTVSDGYGGFKRQWVDSVTFNAAIVLDSSIQAQLAMAQGVTGVYTVTTGK